MQPIEEIRALLSSDTPRVLVDAPAGCGKTYEAVALAFTIAADLKPNQQVLLLTHTNAAKNEFNRRSTDRAGANKVRISTLDAFFLELCTPHTVALGLPNPIKAGLEERTITFESLAQSAAELFRRAPRLAEVVGLRFPFIILDEHQDASIEQHASVCAVADASGARVRFFGDPMQAIYGFNGAAISLEDVSKTVDGRCELSTPWRWKGHEELGRWILEARSALRDGKPLPLHTAPRAVQVHRVGVLPDPGYSQHHDAALLKIVRDFGHQTCAVVLTRTNRQAEALDLQTAGTYTMNEGADFDVARRFLSAVGKVSGDPQAVAACFVDLIRVNSIGFDAAKRAQVSSSLGKDKVTMGRKKAVEPVLQALSPIYATPTVRGACAAVGAILATPPPWLKRFTKPRNLSLVASIAMIMDDHNVALEAAITHERQLRKTEHRAIGTIHKAKGLEYPNVLLWNFSSVDFPLTDEVARLVYVAISRATESLAIVAPGGAVSPLLP